MKDTLDGAACLFCVALFGVIFISAAICYIAMSFAREGLELWGVSIPR